MLSWIFILLHHWNNSLQVDMLLHYDTLSWFRANQSFLFLLNTVYFAEKQQIPILKSRFEPMISYTWGEYANHHTNDVVYIMEYWELCHSSTLWPSNHWRQQVFFRYIEQKKISWRKWVKHFLYKSRWVNKDSNSQAKVTSKSTNYTTASSSVTVNQSIR